jgi:hypothetical protein
MIGGINETIALGYELPTVNATNFGPFFLTPNPGSQPTKPPNSQSHKRRQKKQAAPALLNAVSLAALVVEFQNKVRAKLAELRGAERMAKTNLELAKNNQMASLKSESERRKYLHDEYVPMLRKVGLYYPRVKAAIDVLAEEVNGALGGYPNNKDREIVLDWRGAPPGPNYSLVARKKRNTGADLMVAVFVPLFGAAAYVQVVVNPTPARPVFAKRLDAGLLSDPGFHQKQYVQDDRAVFTPRFAYGAKSVENCVRLLLGEKMVGRYIRQGGNVTDIDEQLKAQLPELKGQTKLTTKQVLYVNQELGSGAQQRGICLSSSPKLIHSNQGVAFASEDACLVKVDLARVAPNAGLYNLYSEPAQAHTIGMEHTRSVDGNQVTFSAAESKDHTNWSTAKNREIFLQELKLEHVANTADLVQEVKDRLKKNKDAVSTALATDFANRYR